MVSDIYKVSISIHALLAESDDKDHYVDNRTGISIHALLAESDPKRYPAILGNAISIHALLAESDTEEVSGDTWQRDFYPRSPCGERLLQS